MYRLLIAAALWLTAPLATAQAYNAQAYKWTDATGTVHYADTPPPQGTHYNTIATTQPTSDSSAAQPAAGTAASATTPAQPAASSAITPDNRAKLCASLKSNLDALNSSKPVAIEENGQRKLLDADQRAQQQSATQAQYQQYCAGN